MIRWGPKQQDKGLAAAQEAVEQLRGLVAYPKHPPVGCLSLENRPGGVSRSPTAFARVILKVQGCGSCRSKDWAVLEARLDFLLPFGLSGARTDQAVPPHAQARDRGIWW